jgi:cell wall-associated NlpC family hydrolase
MSELGKELIASARSAIGASFSQHYTNLDPCRPGNGQVLTDPICMKNGLGQENSYDCMGLVIDSMRRVLGISSWPTAFRHLEQFDGLGEDRVSRPGDVLLFYRSSDLAVHMGILVHPMVFSFIHSTAYKNLGVVESEFRDETRFKCISPEVMASLPDLAKDK